MGILSADLYFAATIRPWQRLSLCGGYLLLGAMVSRQPRPLEFGLRVRPAQGWRWWLPVYAVFLLACVLGGAGVWYSVTRMGNPVGFRSMFAGRTGVKQFAVFACIVAPVVEEAIYRVVVCTSLRVWLGPWATVVLAGAAFSFLHVRYGNPAPDNLVAGFFLVWAFLKSGSVVVPLLFHALGNVAAVSLHAAIIGQT